MKTLGNLIWLLLGGLITGMIMAVVGLVLCLTIVGIPFGKQCFKIGNLDLSPFGKTVYTDFGSHPIANVIWMIFAGIWLGMLHLYMAILYCVTIIGIPFGKQHFKLAKLALHPFGATIY